MQTKEFQAAVNSQAYPVAPNPNLVGIVDQLITRIADATQKAMAIGLSGQEITGLTHRLRDEAEARWMRTRYATIDPDFMEGVEGKKNQQQFVLTRKADSPEQVEMKGKLARDEVYEPSKTEAKIETVIALPVFVCEWMSYSSLRDNYTPNVKRSGWLPAFPVHRENNAAQLPAVRLAGVHYRSLTVSASVKMPEGITPAMFARIRRCIAFLELFDVLLVDRDLSEIAETSRGYRNDRIEVGVLWAPVEEAWAFSAIPPRPAGDPAILVRHYGTSYLVGYFDTPDEKPIDNLIREFSEGPLGNLKS